MLESFRLHHIGIAVKSIEKTAGLYVDAGYAQTDTVYDPVQNVDVCFLTKDGMPTLELVAPKDETSPVFNTLQKMGVSPYHFCYVVDCLEDAVAELRKQKYVLLSKPVNAVAFCNGRICFLFHKDVGLIELVEETAING